MTATARTVLVEVHLTPWRESTPPGMKLRDWRPASEMLPSKDTNGDPGLHGVAACVRDERQLDAKGDRRFSWRIWTPIGTNWPYGGGTAATEKAACAAADTALDALCSALSQRATP